MVSKTSVPASFILGTYYKNYNDIVGKYSNYNTMIASGSIFYTDLLVSEENLPDSMLYNINEGERLVSFKVNTESTYGNSIMPGNLVDVYVKLVNDNNKVVYGELLEKVEVLAVKDSSGKNVFETTEEIRVPSNIYFALPEAKYLLYSSLNYVEDYYSKYEIEIVLVPNTVKYQDTDPMATEVSSDYFYDFVTSKIATIDDQKDLYDALINEMEQLKKEKKDEQINKKNKGRDKDGNTISTSRFWTITTIFK